MSTARLIPSYLTQPVGRAVVDPWLATAVVAILGLGYVMVVSASLHIAAESYGNPWFYAIRQAIFIGLGLLAAGIAFRVPVAVWQRLGPWLLLTGLVMLVLVLIPGIGRTVNGATRWIDLGVFNLQVSELMKLAVIVYLAGYLVRRGEEVRTSLKGFLKPMAVMAIIAVLLLAEPDFGATAVILATAMAMMFIGGVRFWQFGALLGLVVSLMALMAVAAPYRMRRLTTFLDPWQDPFDSGFQLTQALIAIGRGEIFGVGLGSGVQKLSYLPEAHTDFLFSVMAEEFGLIGSLLVIGLFSLFVLRAFVIARSAENGKNPFAAYMAYGLALWLGMQAFINIGVNMGVLPTKGLTLPLMSYGGSSIVVCCVAVALLLRVDYETRRALVQAERRSGKPDKRLLKAERRRVEA